jgi:DNA-binding XRE family transcriptional regulator
MAKNFRELEARMTPAARARAAAKTHDLLRSLPLDELREARDLTQEHLASVLHVNQSAISKLERRTDMYVSTLENFIRAMGGQLEIRAIFPDGAVRIEQFGKIEKR